VQSPDAPRRFLAPDAARVGQTVTLGPEQSRHLATVLRIGVGDRVRLFDGRGREFLACVECADPAAARARLCEACEPAGGRPALLTLAFAPPPGQRADVLIEKATELGASRFVPLACERLQGFQASAAARRVARWERKARDAARQSGRAVVPEVCAPTPFEPFVQADEAELRLIGSTGDAPALWRILAGVPDRPGAATMVVGPAGGFSLREMECARQAGFAPVSLGPHVLRVETAAVAMLAVVTAWLDAPTH